MPPRDQSDLLKASPERQLAVRVQDLMFAMNEPLANWTFYLVHPDYDKSPELRNMIFCILISALAEIASEAENRLGALRRDANRLNVAVAQKHLVFVQAFADGVAHLLGEVENDEFIALQRWRHSLVHGRINSGFQERFAVYVVRGSHVATTKIDREKYLDRTIETTQRYASPQGLMEAMRIKFTHRESFFWTLSMAMNATGFMGSVAREFNENRTDLVRVKLLNDRFIDTHELYVRESRDVRSLWGWRDHIASQAAPARLDQLLGAARR